MDVLEKLVNDTSKIISKSLDKNDYEIAKGLLADYIAVTRAGFEYNKKNNMTLLSNIGSSSNSNGDYRIIGLNFTFDLYSALFINGISSHVLELDDGERRGQIHLGAPIITSILTVNSKEMISNRRMLESILFGYEIGIRLSIALQPNHTKNGFHATATIGAIAASAGVAYLLGLSNFGILNSLKISMISGVGFLKVIDSDSNLKPTNVANAAVRAVTSVMLAKSGFVAPSDVLEGDYGYKKVVSSISNLSVLLSINDKMFKNIYIKQYPSCRHTHGPIDALKAIKMRHEINIETIKDVNLYIYDYVINKHDHKNIKNTNSAKMSIPYSLALEIVFGEINLDYFSPRYLNSIELQEAMSKINIIEDKNFTLLLPQIRKCKIEIIYDDGDVLVEEIEYPKGEPENPLTAEEFYEKFYDLLKYSRMSEEDINCLYDQIFNLDNINKLNIFDLLKVEEN